MSPRPWTSLAFPGLVTQAVTGAKGFKERFGRLAVHPYNEHQPDRSVWWLFPPGKSQHQHWPAYHLGKFVIHKPLGKSAMRIGLHVEKGTGLQLAAAYGGTKAKNFAMTDRWLWHSFLKDLESGRVAQALDQIRARSGLAPEIEVEAGAPLDEPKLRTRPSSYRFSCGVGGTLKLVEHHVGDQGLPGLERARTIPELAQILALAKGGPGEMLWLNLIVGLEIPVAAERDGTKWDGSAIWINAMEPLASWVRATP